MTRRTQVLASPPGPVFFHDLLILPAAPAAEWLVANVLGAGAGRTVWVLAAALALDLAPGRFLVGLLRTPLVSGPARRSILVRRHAERLTASGVRVLRPLALASGLPVALTFLFLDRPLFRTLARVLRAHVTRGSTSISSRA